MELKEIYSNRKSNKPVISYEVFPPKDDADGQKLEQLFVELKKLLKFKPSLISVTYGAGGSNQTESIEIIKRIKSELNTTPMPHFTCVSTSEKNIKTYLKTLEQLGIENILALRGDLPENTTEICKDFCHANELVEYLKHKTDFSIAVAGYPEGHIESSSLKEDLENLKKKIDSGADAIFTQMFFLNEKFYSYLETLEKNGIDVPVIAGIMPIISAKQLEKMTQLARITIPSELKQKIEKHSTDKNYIKNLGIEFSTAQCKELLANNVKGLHFFTLNRAYSTSKILDNIL